MANLIVICTLFLVTMAILRHVPQGQVYSVYRRGRPSRILKPGLHIVVPPLERIGHRIPLRGQMLSWQASNAQAPLHAQVYWQVLDPVRADAAIDQLDKKIRHGLDEALRSYGDIQTPSTELGQAWKQDLNTTLQSNGILVTRVELSRH